MTRQREPWAETERKLNAAIAYVMAYYGWTLEEVWEMPLSLLAAAIDVSVLSTVPEPEPPPR